MEEAINKPNIGRRKDNILGEMMLWVGRNMSMWGKGTIPCTGRKSTRPSAIILTRDRILRT